MGKTVTARIKNYCYETVEFTLYLLLLRRVVNIFFCIFRVLETVRSVPTSRMGCFVCLDVPKACQGRMTHSFGNMRIRLKFVSYATKTALKGKSIVLPTGELTLHFFCVVHICLLIY